MKFSFKLISFAGLLLSFGCNNISSLNRKLASFNLPDPYEGSGGGAFVLQTALPSQHRPGYFDLIGSGGQFDLFCSDALPCKCEYTYNYPSQGTQTSQVTAVDQESDLMRCSSSVPQGISSYDIAIISGDGNLSSNKITVSLSAGTFAGSTFYIDLSSKSSFVNVKRFQCRKLETIMNPLDGNFIDPFQSEDPKIIYPFNYYTTNVSESLLQAQHNANQDWDCTLIPNKDHTVKDWANPYVFSREICNDSFCASDYGLGTQAASDVMYPKSDLSQVKVSATASTNIGARGTFSLSKQSYGVFQVPIRAAVAPKDYVSSNYGVIGYAAETVPSGTTSSCPSITLPTGARWVKLWNFRAAAITPPQYVKGIVRFGDATPGNIACNPGGVNKSCDYTNVASLVPACNGTFGCTLSQYSSYADQPNRLLGVTTSATTLTRILGLSNATTPACYRVDAGNTWNAVAVGAAPINEEWQPSPYAFADATPPPGVSDFRALSWGIFSDALAINNNGTGGDKTDDFVTGSGAASKLSTAVPKESAVTLGQFSNDNYTDNLFVVTPETINDDAMKNEASSVSQYLPVTYRTAAKCNASGGGFTDRSTCSTSYEIPWTIMTSEVGTQSSQVYPVCVVQFYE